MQKSENQMWVPIPVTAFYGADDDGDNGSSTEPQEGASNDDGNDDDDDDEKFDKSYVKKLRDEAASRRVAAKESAEKVKTLEAKLAEIKQAEMDDLEKAQENLKTESVRATEAEARANAAEADLISERVNNAVTLAAVEMRFQDPADALTMISQNDLVNDEGEISTKTVKARLKALTVKKPYLLKTPGKGSGDGGAGITPANETTFKSKSDAYYEEMIKTGGRVSA